MRYKKIIVFYLLAVLVGVLTGILGSFFQLAIYRVTHWMHVMMQIISSFGVPNYVSSPLLTLIMVLIAWGLVRRIAPEASGSGIPDIEGALLHQRHIYWRRLIPVKFIGGVLSISANLVMGREGPTVQMGGNVGQMVGDYFRLSPKRCDALVAAGAAAGLATAFNAPLAGVLFVIEEMRHAFALPFIHFKTVAISCVAASVVLQALLGGQPVITMPIFEAPHLEYLWVFFVFGLGVGFVGIFFNYSLMATLNWMDHQSARFRLVYVIGVALLIGCLTVVWPDTVGGGYDIIENALRFTPSVRLFLILLITRFATMLLCYNTSVPGGIFAPMLALGTLLGMACSTIMHDFLPSMLLDPGILAVAGMGALFSATVRAPLTGIVLVVEMTQNYALIFPLMVACLTATTVVQLAGVAPIYTQLLRRNLKDSSVC